MPSVLPSVLHKTIKNSDDYSNSVTTPMDGHLTGVYMSLTPIHQRYLDVYPIKFTRTIRPPLWFWYGLDGLTDNISDATLKARALKDYEEDKDDLEDSRRKIIEDIYIDAYPFTDDIEESGTPWCTMGLKYLNLDMSEAEVIARAIADYEEDKSEIEMHNAYHQKMKEEEEEEEE